MIWILWRRNFLCGRITLWWVFCDLTDLQRSSFWLNILNFDTVSDTCYCGWGPTLDDSIIGRIRVSQEDPFQEWRDASIASRSIGTSAGTSNGPKARSTQSTERKGDQPVPSRCRRDYSNCMGGASAVCMFFVFEIKGLNLGFTGGWKSRDGQETRGVFSAQFLFF